MFRSIVSNIAFSPALVGQLSFYAKRLRREELTRRLGLIFTALALVVQSLAVFSPPEPANASSSADFVRGGVSSVSDFLKYYDQNSNNIKSIYDSLGIKRSEIASATQTTIGEDSRYNWSMTSLYSHAEGQRSWNYGPGTAFYRPMRLTQQGGDRHEVFAAHSESMGWFAIKKDCGNLVTAKPPQPPQPVADCVNLTVVPVSQTRFRFNGKASHQDGADIFSYVYRVFDESNKRVDEIVSQSGRVSDSVVYDRSQPGKYTVRLFIRASTGVERDKDCADTFRVADKPEAECKAVRASIHDRTIVSLAGSATAQNGATISSYQFTVRDKNNKIVKRVIVNSTKQTETAESFELTKAGTYTVKLKVTTSVGERSNTTSCEKQFKIVPPQVCAYNPELPINSPDCQPCPDSPDIWIKDEKCTAVVVSTKSGSNLTQGNVDATTVLANASDKLSYTLTVKNTGLAPTSVDITETLTDVLQYASVIDGGGGSFDQVNQTLNWPSVQLTAGESQSRTFVVQLLHNIPLTNTGTSDEASYDCVMTNTFGNTIAVNVNCPLSKEIVENTVSELPKTGPGENAVFGVILLATVTYFYARSRQLGKEVRLVRRNVNAGAF